MSRFPFVVHSEIPALLGYPRPHRLNCSVDGLRSIPLISNARGSSDSDSKHDCASGPFGWPGFHSESGASSPRVDRQLARWERFRRDDERSAMNCRESDKSPSFPPFADQGADRISPLGPAPQQEDGHIDATSPRFTSRYLLRSGSSFEVYRLRATAAQATVGKARTVRFRRTAAVLCGARVARSCRSTVLSYGRACQSLVEHLFVIADQVDIDKTALPPHSRMMIERTKRRDSVFSITVQYCTHLETVLTRSEADGRAGRPS
jgi:hypothetical protein